MTEIEGAASSITETAKERVSETSEWLLRAKKQ